MSVVVQLLVAYLLSHTSPVKSEARQYIKDKLNGWQERIALVLFDAAWDIALGSVGNRVGSLSKEQANVVAEVSVAVDKALLA